MREMCFSCLDEYEDELKFDISFFSDPNEINKLQASLDQVLESKKAFEYRAMDCTICNRNVKYRKNEKNTWEEIA